MSFGIYIVGFVILVAGVAWGLSLAGLAPQYIAIACLCLIGLGIMSGVAKTRSKDPPT